MEVAGRSKHHQTASPSAPSITFPLTTAAGRRSAFDVDHA